MRARKIHMIEGTAWTVLTFVWGAITVAHLIQGTDTHSASITALLTCILAKMAFKAANDE